ncbi:MAG: GNAT family N-acetyltransferase [Ilumatobacteraceae bacterium]
MAATGVSEERGFSVRIADAAGATAAGPTGWTWGTCAGINLVRVGEERRARGLGRRLLAAAENLACERGCDRIFVSSFTFQAPGLYARNGHREIARVPGLLADDVSDVWFVKPLA